MRIKTNNLSLRQLRAFAAVARNRSFSAAARELFITPSALSETIRQLEEQVGVRLLDRTTRSVNMTAAGEEFDADVDRLLAGLELAVLRMNDIGSARRGLVRVTGVASVLAKLAAPCVAQLLATNPGVLFDVIEDGTAGIVSTVLEGKADIGIGVMPEVAPDGIVIQPLVSDRYGVVAAKGHAALAQQHLTVRSLSSWDYVAAPLAGELAALLAETLTPRVRLNNLATVVPLLEAGGSVSVFPYLGVSRLLTRRLAYKPFNRPSYLRHVAMIRRQSRSLSPAAQLLWDAMARSAPTLLAVDDKDNAGLVKFP